MFAIVLPHEFSRIHEHGTGLSQPIPSEFAPVGPASTFAQQKSKGKAEARIITSTEMTDRRNKRILSKRAAEPCPPAE